MHYSSIVLGSSQVRPRIAFIISSIVSSSIFVFLGLAKTRGVSSFGIRRSVAYSCRQQRSSTLSSLLNYPLLLQLQPDSDVTSSPSSCSYYSHDDIIWQLGPSTEAPLWTKLMWKSEANRVSSLQNFNNVHILIPQRAATIQPISRNSTAKNPMARFGITTESGPFCNEMEETIQDIYHDDCRGGSGVAAIKYMFVEPHHRKKGLGKLALEVISQIHAWQNCSYTVLIADDDGSGKLIQWYESNGFTRAPKLDRVFGCVQESYQNEENSPTAALGVAMIAPTCSTIFSNLNNIGKNSGLYIRCL